MNHKIFPAFFLCLGTFSILSAQSQTADLIAAGNRLYYAKDYAGALKAYQQAAQADPSSANVFQAMGNCDYLLGMKQDALAAYQKCLSLNPSNPAVSGFVQRLQGELAAAPSPAASAAYPTASNAATPSASPNTRSSHRGVYFELGGGVDLPASQGGQSGGDGHFRLGYAFDSHWSAQVEYQVTFPYQTDYLTTQNDRVIPEMKWVPGPGEIEPYLVGGLGLEFFTASGGYWNSQTYRDRISSYPDFTLGCGVQTCLADAVNLYVEDKYNVFVASGGTSSEFPLIFGIRADF